jgi:hypothetical protein
MPSKSLKNSGGKVASTATSGGPKPADFPLGSVESRAAARAMVHRLAEKDGPQPGDISIDLTFLTLQRAAEIYRLHCSVGESREAPGRVPGHPKMWLKFPKGFNPDSVPDSTPPLTFENAPDDLLKDVIRYHNEAFRKAKDSGQALPPELDPDLAWNGMAYVPKQTVPKVTG